MRRFLALVQREQLLLWQGRAQLLPFFAYPLLVLLVAVFALDIARVELPVRQALVLIALLLAQLTILPLAWRVEISSGVLAQLWLAQQSLLPAVAARYVVYLAGLLLPLGLLLLAAGALLLQLPVDRLVGPIMLALPTFLGLALFSGALTVGVKNNAALPALLLLPFYVPVIILMALAATAPDPGLAQACQWWLGALAALSAGLLPFATAAALRQALAA